MAGWSDLRDSMEFYKGEQVLRYWHADYCDRSPRCYVPGFYRNETDMEWRLLNLETTDQDIREQEH